MTTLWMIEDLEFWPDEPAPGQVCEPTTYWAGPGMPECVPELVHEVSARVEQITVAGRVEQLAHLGHGFTTMLRDHLDTVGDVTLTGHLVWDRYLWTDYRTRPTGRALVTARRPVIQRAVGTPTEYAGWYSVEYQGPRTVHRDGPVPDGYSIVAYALSVTLH
ncbi:hypothetical protein QM787_22190 [Rhodococcus ruber]|nr:hypothetical protein [Rhodococcus ruber]ETT25789.1 hypothetical protein RR21198_3534 [Rhodococcus rhodochrous ATCC 21198]MCD2129552.1 hypothetical protein [Rhodococcus ruber]MCZ4505403.1 hypothetical protein [Rhodococcus ruber]MCZ4533511.1 hypothetical protein [Rhodococcus ruber]MCZ4623027.1 hypothetical protein [Rhodococcus ruber]